MPWQQYVADVLMEIDPETGRLAYTEFGLTVPRQSGKSTFVLAKATHRCEARKFYGARQSVVYTAQTRKDARKKFEEDFAGVFEESKRFRARVDPRWGNGNEHIRFPNQSRFGIEASTEKAGHGPVLDEAYIDEAFAQMDGRLEQAFRPSMITRANRLLGWISTAGWRDGSPYLESKREKGIAAVEADTGFGLAYFEWSAPEGCDPADEDVWLDCMPAVGYTIDLAAIRDEYEAMDLWDFQRAYLNLWVPKGGEVAAQTVVDITRWGELIGVEEIRPAPVALAVSASPDRKWSTIALAGARRDGGTQLQIIQTGRGTEWVPARLDELRRQWKPVGIAIGTDDPASSLIPDLEKIRPLKNKLLKVSQGDYARACGRYVDGVNAGTIWHSDQPVLNISVGAARWRKTGDSKVIAPPKDATDVSPLKAAALALYALASKKPAEQQPHDTPRRAVIL